MAINFNPLDVLSGFNLTKLNQNFQNIKTALADGLSRSGGSPNQMNADIDMNSNDLLNVRNVSAEIITIDGVSVQPVDLATALKISNALSELPAAGLDDEARDNLGLGSVATHNLNEFVLATGETVIDLLRIGCVAGSSTEAANNATKLLTAIAATPSTGYKIYVPGRFYIGSLGVLSGKSISIEGWGPEISSLLATQTSGFFLDLQQDDFTDSVRISNLSIETETITVTRALRVQFNENDATNNKLQGRCTIENVEIRGVDVGAHGFLSGIDLTNVHRPIISKVNISGRQNGPAPTGFQHMEYGWNLTNVGTGVPTDFMFSLSTVVAAQKAYKGSGALEGITFDRVYAIAVGRGFDFAATTPRPFISINGCHVAAFERNISLQNFWQSWIKDCLLYKREDSNANTIAIYLDNCDSMKVVDNTIVNVAGLPSTFGNYDGVVLIGSDLCNIENNDFGALQKGVDIQTTSSNNTYRKGQWHDAKGTGSLVEYQVSGSGTGNIRRGQLLDVSARNSGGAVVVTGVSGVAVASTATDNLEVGDDIEVFFSMQCDKDVNAGHVRAIVVKGGTATIEFDNNKTQLDVEVNSAASQIVRIRGSAKARVTARGSCTFELQGFAPANQFTVPVNTGQIQAVRR